MTYSSKKIIHAGKEYRITNDVELQVYNYHEMNIDTIICPAGQLIQPWDTFASWHGKKIPLSLDEYKQEFDWGMRTGIVHFIKWNDFFPNCKPVEAEGLWDALKRGFNSIPIHQIRQGNRSKSDKRIRASGQNQLLPAAELFDSDNEGRTRLFYAAKRGNLAEVEKMIYRFPGTGLAPQRLGFIERKDNHGKMAADIAEKNGHDEVASFLRKQVVLMEYYG